MPNHNMKDETGNRYGRLIVLKRVENDRFGKCHWLCHCDCGDMCTIGGANLRSGTTKSCGCLKRESMIKYNKTWRLHNGQAAFNQLYLRYERGAKTRGLRFDLTKEDLSFLTQMNCYYCGTEPFQIIRGPTFNGSYTYNGIDRIDNARGYAMNNVVSCCGLCNRMKGTLKPIEFLEHIIKIYKYKKERKNL